jgi:modulator of FtsH protease HflK
MPWSNGGQRSGGGPPRNLEDLLKRSQDKLRQVMPDGSGLPGSFIFLLAARLVSSRCLRNTRRLRR